MVSILLDKAGLSYKKVYAEDMPEFFKEKGIKEAPTLLVEKKDGFELIPNPSNIKKFIEETRA